MDKFEKGVPFDPGYSKIAYSFIENIAYITSDYSQLKDFHKKKFKLTLIEPKIVELINICSAFYLGCMLWGGFAHYKFKDCPKELLGNTTKDLTDEELKELDCAEETEFMLEYIAQFDRDCKYYLKKPAKVESFILDILKSYVEFVQLNNNFVSVNKTDEIKLPKTLQHFEKLTDEQLDKLQSRIFKIIESGNIKEVLGLGFYQI